ncbi:SDR family NAD(P)-dependent oxidoreductase [Bacillus sp. MCCB 382]|uniref:SDR family NAD(P)-dependent oxidoreductase n=1 Tax=Bacillus sp. MCCB 382 TaxID=2860197 RepID=UPI001C573729|nr:SDR family NAD(P)-dependent oxidoreductase [Bacillus sp. MCCB 382]
MKKAMVVGASGGMGYSLVLELVSRGIEVVAFARGKSKLSHLYSSIRSVSIQTGDAMNREQLIHASNGCDAIFHALNLPYEDWKDKLISVTENIIFAAERNNARLAVVDNIYAYGRSGGKKLTEDWEKDPQTRKGKLRLKMDERLKQATIPTLNCHFPDFYGPNATNTYIHFTLQQLLKKKKAGFVGPKHILREFIYTKDGARMMVDLAIRNEAYGQNWNIPGGTAFTGKDIEHELKNILGEEKELYFISKPLFTIFALFAGKGMREALEMQYINSEPTILSGQKLESFLGNVITTPFEQGIRETIAFMDV